MDQKRWDAKRHERANNVSNRRRDYDQNIKNKAMGAARDTANEIGRVIAVMEQNCRLTYHEGASKYETALNRYKVLIDEWRGIPTANFQQHTDDTRQQTRTWAPRSGAARADDD